jgi:3-phosphoshikimate 1-carboxyvinyltransferase
MTDWSSSSPDPRPVPAGSRVSGRLRPPSSKSLTQRFYNLASLAPGPTEVVRPLRSADCEHFLAGLVAVGCALEESAERVLITPPTAAGQGLVQCGASGTMMRFLAAALCGLPGRWELDGEARLRQRPLAELLRALGSLGGRVRSTARPGFLPLEIAGGALAGGRVEVAAHESSQFVSALLMAGAASEAGVTVEVRGLVSAPYVALTEHALGLFGVETEHPAAGVLRVPPNRLQGGASLTVEADVSAACYPAAGAALSGGDVTIEGVARGSAQGDLAFFDLLADMGASVDWLDGAVRVTGTGSLRAVDVDLAGLPDQAPTLAALAPFAAGTTRIRNVAHLRFKESDRLTAMTRELRRLGADVTEHPDGWSIAGVWAAAAPPDEPVAVEVDDDHRIAMSCALVGLRRPGVSICRPLVVAKSYPDFWRDLSRLAP